MCLILFEDGQISWRWLHFHEVDIEMAKKLQTSIAFQVEHQFEVVQCRHEMKTNQYYKANKFCYKRYNVNILHWRYHSNNSFQNIWTLSMASVYPDAFCTQQLWFPISQSWLRPCFNGTDQRTLPCSVGGEGSSEVGRDTIDQTRMLYCCWYNWHILYCLI